MNLTDDLIHLFVSSSYDAASVRTAFEAVTGHGPRDFPPYEDIEAARRVGAALREEDPARAREAAIRWLREIVDWEAVSRDLQGGLAHLFALMEREPLPGRRTLAGVGGSEFRGVFSALTYDQPPSAELAVDLFQWVEYGDEAAFARVRALGRRPVVLGAIDSLDGRGDRLYAALTIAFGDDVGAELRWLSTSALTGYGVITVGAKSLAARLGVPATQIASGLDCQRGGRSDLHGEEHKPLFDLLAQSPTHHDLLRELIPRYVDGPWLAEHLSDTLARVPWDDRWDAPPAASVRRWGSLLVVQNGKRKSHKTEKTTAAAEKAFAKKKDELSAKLGPKDAPPPPNKLDEALFEAASNAKRPAVRRLLAWGAKPDGFVKDDGETALSYRAGEDPEIVRLFAAAGADLDRVARMGATLLDFIAYADPTWNRLACARELLARGAKGRGLQGGTPLHHAARKGNAELVELLLAKGFDPKQPASGPYEGKTPLDLARESGSVATRGVLERALR